MSREGKGYEEIDGEGRTGKKRMGSVVIKRVVKGGLRRVRECKLHHSVII